MTNPQEFSCTGEMLNEIQAAIFRVAKKHKIPDVFVPELVISLGRSMRTCLAKAMVKSGAWDAKSAAEYEAQDGQPIVNEGDE